MVRIHVDGGTPRAAQHKEQDEKYQISAQHKGKHPRQTTPDRTQKGLNDTKSAEALCCVLRLYVFLLSCVEAQCVSVEALRSMLRTKQRLFPTLSPTPH